MRSDKAVIGCIYCICICIIYLYKCCAFASAHSEFPLPESAADLQVGSRTGFVFVAVGNQLFRLDENLAHQENVTLNSNVLKIALSHDESLLVVCFEFTFDCAAGTCMGYNAGNFTDGPQFIAMELFTATNRTALFTSSTDDSFYVGSFGPRTNSTAGNVMQLTRYGHGCGLESAINTPWPAVMPAFYPSLIADMERNFSHGFVVGANVYFFAVDSLNGSTSIRVIRVCHNQAPDASCIGNIDALYEIELECIPPITLMAMELEIDLCGISLLNSSNGVPETTVVLALCGVPNRVCSYKLEDIDLAMDNTYSQCSEGQESVLSPIWMGSTSFPCSSFEVRH